MLQLLLVEIVERARRLGLDFRTSYREALINSQPIARTEGATALLAGGTQPAQYLYSRKKNRHFNIVGTPVKRLTPLTAREASQPRLSLDCLNYAKNIVPDTMHMG